MSFSGLRFLGKVLDNTCLSIDKYNYPVCDPSLKQKSKNLLDTNKLA